MENLFRARVVTSRRIWGSLGVWFYDPESRVSLRSVWVVPGDTTHKEGVEPRAAVSDHGLLTPSVEARGPPEVTPGRVPLVTPLCPFSLSGTTRLPGRVGLGAGHVGGSEQDARSETRSVSPTRALGSLNTRTSRTKGRPCLYL